MANRCNSFRAFIAGKTPAVITSLLGLAAASAIAVAANDQTATLRGSVQGAGSGLADYKVSLYASFVDRGPFGSCWVPVTVTALEISRSAIRCRRDCRQANRYCLCRRSGGPRC